MSVLINMEMPKSCDWCWALDDYGDYPRCRITNEQRGYNFPVREQRMGNCPLIPVPPHGDLIDKSGMDVLSWHDGEYGTDFEDGVLFVLDKLDELPVIIPAEEGE